MSAWGGGGGGGPEENAGSRPRPPGGPEPAGRRRRAGRGGGRFSHLRLGVQGDEVLVVVQQLAGVSNVHGRFLLVAGEDPDLQAGLPQLGDGFGDPVLQAVFDPGGAWSEAHQCG